MPDSSQQTHAPETCPFKGERGFTRLIKATGYSMQGFRAGWRTESAIRQELVSAAILVPLAFILGHTPVERVLLAASVLLVILVELLNSAIEAVVDRIGTQHNELSGRAKDMGSAAVFVALSIVICTWGGLLL